MKFRRGAAIISVLLLITLFFILGAAMLGRQKLAYDAAAQSRDAVVAQGLAEAGLEDARLKLQKDRYFPPPGGPGQSQFTYSESLSDADGKVLGNYQVTIDLRQAATPVYQIRVTSTGTQGDGLERSARRKLVAIFDTNPNLATDPPRPNPNCFRILRVSAEEP